VLTADKVVELVAEVSVAEMGLTEVGEDVEGELHEGRREGEV